MFVCLLASDSTVYSKKYLGFKGLVRLYFQNPG